MKKIILVIFLVLVMANFSIAANIAVSPSGGGSGASWSTPATWSSITFVRGNTYYLMDGNYAGRTFSTGTNGSTLITIKKATASDYGGLAGWSSTYGDGQAVFTSMLDFTSSYWLIDGVTGGGTGSWNSGFGFKILETSDPNALIRTSYSGTANNITVRHVEMQGGGGSNQGGYYSNDGLAIYGSSNITLSYAWMYDIGRCPVFITGAINTIIEHVYVQSFFPTGDVHSEVMSTGQSTMGDLTWRYNLVTVIKSTGGLLWDNNTNPSCSFYVYGNVFYRPSNVTWDEANGIIAGWTGGSGEEFRNVKVYNNTFINCDQPIFSEYPNVYSGNVASNNLFYNCESPTFGRFPTHDYNHYINSGGTHSEVNGTSATSGDPFVDYINLDFRLKAATTTAGTLASPLNIDPLGNTRGADGTWDRGAIEYTSGGGDVTAPVVTITSPTSGSTYSTSSSTINISGTATDAVGVTGVTWSNDRGGSGTCTGTTSWSQSNITLLPGVNILTITARDAANNSSTDTLTVTYIGTDTVPAQFTFTDIGNAARSTVYTSNTITVTGLDATATVTITGGTYSKNGGVYTSSAGTAFYGDTFAVRHTSSSAYATATNTVLTIGGVSDTYTTTTLVDPGDVVAPVCTITSPTSSSTYATATGTINLAGTASDAVGVVSVSWANDRGGSGTATGTTSWSKTGITLYPGVNVLTITARDSANNAGVDTLTVTYTPADSVAPVITITNPTSSATYETSSSTINLSGTASDAVGVVSVSWTNDRGGVGTCTGTTSWSQANIVLYSGANILTVTARDAANNAGTDTLTVTYTPVAGGSPTTIKGVYLKGVRR